MTPFLKQVAGHYFPKDAPQLGRRCYVLPNRRAVLFFKKYLSELVARSAVEATLAPEILTINEFFYKLQRAHNTDRLQLLLTLHECYCRISGSDETLDDFIFWGDMILADFSDVDKYLINPEHIFSNIAQLKELSCEKDYLSEAQVEAIAKFVSHFDKDISSKKYIKRFRTIWDTLLPLYQSFNAALQEKGETYEGRVYRQMAQRFAAGSCVDILKESFPNTEIFVFAGLNVLCECEKTVLAKMRNAGLAEFCWDYSSSWIKDPRNKSSFFMKGNLEAFPQAFELDPEGLGTPEINLVSVPSNIGQTKQLATVLGKLGTDTGMNTAVVLPDESQLIPVQNSIPAYIKDINVTMGYPMSGSALWAVMDDISSLQMHLRQKDGKWYFYHRQVFSLLSNPLVRSILGHEDIACVEKLKKDSKYYIPQEDFAGDLLRKIFRPVVTDPASTELVGAIEDYQLEILVAFAGGIASQPEMEIELDFAREYYLAISRLKSYAKLDVLPVTYFRVLDGLIGRCSVPFHGEPLRGLQIMGPLETRALDFDNLIILNFNEGVFPRHSRSESFIPSELRSGFNLPTYEYQDAVWSYYFYRMIQRASKVWLLVDSRTEGVRVGEESRYVKQLEMHFGAKVNRYSFNVPVAPMPVAEDIPKTEEHIALIETSELSASAMKDYISCPVRFFYSKVEGLRAQEDIQESMDAGAFGNVFHKTMQNLYHAGKITDVELKGILAGDRIAREVEKNILAELKTVEVAGRNLVLEELLVRYVRQTIRRDMELLKEKKLNGFTMLGAELRYVGKIAGQNFKGFVDRLDSFEPQVVRIVDYKTGRVEDEDFLITDDNADSIVAALFGDDDSKRPKIALQLYVYDKLVGEKEKGSKLVNSIYQPARLFAEGVREVSLSPRFCEQMEKALADTIQTMKDTSVPWKRAKDLKTCQYCNFKTICGR